MSVQLAVHQHGKGQVRVGRVWREGDKTTFVEWTANIMLESDMAHAYLTDSNEDMTPTDTQKNTVYYVAKRMPPNSSPEEFALALAKHFVKLYPKVSKTKVGVEQAPWSRLDTPEGKHQHGYVTSNTGIRTAYAEYSEDGTTVVHGGIKGWKVLKTTQSGYEGYCRDEYTKLKPTKERMLASSVTTTWKYSQSLPEYHGAFEAVKAAMAAAFFGPPKEGVYSPSVQYTLFRMAQGALESVKAVESVYLNMPNIHYLPCDPVNSEPFDHDVYVATSEPFGNIEATITRESIPPHAKL